jgi:predicted DNA-binding antitoxin AbrB/MazE fold protein
MSQLEAVYQDGVFKPLGQVTLPQNQRVRLTVESVPGDDPKDDFTGLPRGLRGTAQAWTSEKNTRRRDLIDKQIDGTLLPEEEFELGELQRQATAYRDRVAPLPIDGARKLHQELLEKKRLSESEG